MNLRNILIYILNITTMVGVSQCSSMKDLESKPPVKLGEVYFQNWNSGVKGQGGGTNIFIPTTDTSTKLEEVYFNQEVAKLVFRNGVYIGQFKTTVNQLDPLMSEEENIEKSKSNEFPFILKENQCVISYRRKDEIRYFKIDSILQKETLNLYSLPDKQDIKIRQ